MKNKTIIIVLRWFAVLPAAVLGLYLSGLIATAPLLYDISVYSLLGTTDFVKNILSCAISGASFVYFGSIIAPKSKNIVAIILATTLTAALIMLVVFYIKISTLAKIDFQYILLLWVAITITSAIATCYFAIKIDLDKNKENGSKNPLLLYINDSMPELEGVSDADKYNAIVDLLKKNERFNSSMEKLFADEPLVSELLIRIMRENKSFTEALNDVLSDDDIAKLLKRVESDKN